MGNLNDEDIEAIVDSLYEKIRDGKNHFVLEPEKHYNDHKSVDNLLEDYRLARNIFWKAFIGLAILGSLFMAAFSMGIHKP